MTDAAPVPAPVARVAELMSPYPFPWALCGGWAVDAWLGRTTRDHHDVDVVVLHEDQRALFDHLAGWRLVGHDDEVDDESTEPWDGRRLSSPAHVHVGARDGVEPEFHLVEREGPDWVLRREPRETRPLASAIARAPWGLPTVVPEVLVYYKALPPSWRRSPRTPPRPHDDLDLEVLWPLLEPASRRWVERAVEAEDPRHPWRAALAR